MLHMKLVLFGTICLILIAVGVGSANDTDSFTGNSGETKNLKKDEESRSDHQNALKKAVVRQIIADAATENCNWLQNPIAILQGGVCGSHYKVLNLNRRKSPFDKSTVRKAYHKQSLYTHPDKNPGKESETAFTHIQSAYECLSDATCLQEYNDRLNGLEAQVRQKRIALRDKIVRELKYYFNIAHSYVLAGATHVCRIANELTSVVDDWRVVVFDRELPLGKLLAGGFLLFKARIVLYTYLLSIAMVRINEELVRSRQSL